MKFLVKRQLREISKRIRRTDQEIAVLDAQLVAAADDLDDTRVRSLVSDVPLDQLDFEDARRQHHVLERERARLKGQVERLRRQRDELLDKLVD